MNAEAARTPVVILAGCPNAGKSSLFNRLTGSRQKVANYPGVTVEYKEGLVETAGGESWRVIDVPGAYSLRSHSRGRRSAPPRRAAAERRRSPALLTLPRGKATGKGDRKRRRPVRCGHHCLVADHRRHGPGPGPARPYSTVRR